MGHRRLEPVLVPMLDAFKTFADGTADIRSHGESLKALDLLSKVAAAIMLQLIVATLMPARRLQLE